MMHHMNKMVLLLAAIGLILSTGGLQPIAADDMGMGGGSIGKAVALIHPLEGQDVHGVVHFTETKEGLRVQGEFWNLKPGLHGFHVHEYADCTAPNEGTVGPHYLPMEEGHAGMASGKMEGHGHGDTSYWGDLPPIEAGQDGHVTYDAERKGLSLNGPRSVIGRGLLVHAISGEKIGCGVIGIDKE